MIPRVDIESINQITNKLAGDLRTVSVLAMPIQKKKKRLSLFMQLSSTSLSGTPGDPLPAEVHRAGARINCIMDESSINFKAGLRNFTTLLAFLDPAVLTVATMAVNPAF